MSTSYPTFPVPTPGDDPKATRRRDALQHLLTRLVDAREGLDSMLKRAEREIEPTLKKLREEHHEAAERVTALMVAEGAEPDGSGSAMATVNKTVVSLRAAFDELDEDALEQVADGEQTVLDAFTGAIEEHDEGRTREELVDMRATLRDLVDEARRVAAG
ncbi:DUF2383 domain-containing protein [Roseibacterium sp. SDUM158017]|uniref:DUF2383 domain-containing protein n=1 Tax=Roseicyclus salinarum TaxID=3036773 RepID=UPI002414D93A|nr:DUF2383 domain-containing protein [Roseibacterium sp. SDUM158017]MDG4649421.1 DUF2383 domain-containing protein [Roseibacterium sp. SDUM158017]